MGPRFNRRGGRGGGFAGKEDLEATRRYRASDENGDRRGDEYGMVFDVQGGEAGMGMTDHGNVAGALSGIGTGIGTGKGKGRLQKP